MVDDGEMQIAILIAAPDMLKKKLKTIPFKDYVPAFPGENSFTSVSTYLSKLYQDIVREAPRPPGASTRSVQVSAIRTASPLAPPDTGQGPLHHCHRPRQHRARLRRSY